jgi:DNA-binding HxlR family transcriptional regulator
MNEADDRDEELCSIARALEVLGDRWTLLVLRDADLGGLTRFADFRARLGIASDVLTDRLAALVEAGVMEKRPYREKGARTRFGYHLTPAGRRLRVVLAALQQWGDENRPPAVGPTVARRSSDGHAVHVAFVDDTGAVISPEDVQFMPTAAYPA